MSKTSAGLLLYRLRNTRLEVLLGHPGGPFWKNKDNGAWMIPKGEIEAGEGLLEGAIREFEEETGLAPTGPYFPLGHVKHRSGKTVHAWAFEGDADPRNIRSNTFRLEWPPKSGRIAEFPEIDRAEFFDVQTAWRKLLPAERPLLQAFAREHGESVGEAGTEQESLFG